MYLSLPEYPLKIILENKHKKIWDIARRKYVPLTPEELIRQQVIHYLVKDLGAPVSLIRVEKGEPLGDKLQRFDVAVFNPQGQALLVVECKAPGVPLGQSVLDQAGRYNQKLRARFLWVTNGNEHHCYSVDFRTSSYKRVDTIPPYENMKKEADK